MIWYLFWDTLGLRYIMFFKSKTEEVKTLGKLAISGCQLSKKVVSSSPSSMSTVHVQKCWMIGTPLNNCVQQSKKRRKLLATHNYSGKFARDLPSSSSCCYSKSLHSLIHPVSYLWQVSFVPLKVLIKSYAHFDKWKQILKMKAHFENESTFWE